MSAIEDDGNIKPEWSISYYDLEFGELIGRGNFGEVYRGEYCGTEVAIKKILPVDDDEENEKYTAREISMLTGVRHPNVVNFMGVAKRVKHGVEYYYIVTEWLPGNNLRKIMKDPKVVIGWRRRIELARDAALAMCYLHKKNIIHRDLKSANLMLAADGSLKVCDFGLARKTNSRKPGAYTMAGTEEWMAPEVIVGDEYDEKCDVFSYGAVLYELMTRQKPQARGPSNGYEFNFKQWTRVIPPECPKALSQLAMRCVDYNPKNRPPFTEVVRTIKEILASDTIPPDTNEVTPLPLSPRHVSAKEREAETQNAFKARLFEALGNSNPPTKTTSAPASPHTAHMASSPPVIPPVSVSQIAVPVSVEPRRPSDEADRRDYVEKQLRENKERLEQLKKERDARESKSNGTGAKMNDSGNTTTKKKKGDKDKKKKKKKGDKKTTKKSSADSSSDIPGTGSSGEVLTHKKGKSTAGPSASASSGEKLKKSTSLKSKDAAVAKKKKKTTA